MREPHTSHDAPAAGATARIHFGQVQICVILRAVPHRSTKLCSAIGYFTIRNHRRSAPDCPNSPGPRRRFTRSTIMDCFVSISGDMSHSAKVITTSPGTDGTRERCTGLAQALRTGRDFDGKCCRKAHALCSSCCRESLHRRMTSCSCIEFPVSHFLGGIKKARVYVARCTFEACGM